MDNSSSSKAQMVSCLPAEQLLSSAAVVSQPGSGGLSARVRGSLSPGLRVSEPGSGGLSARVRGSLSPGPVVSQPGSEGL